MDLYTFILYIVGMSCVYYIFCGIISTIDNILTHKQWRNQYYNDRYVNALIKDGRQYAYRLGMTDELKEMVDWFEAQLLTRR